MLITKKEDDIMNFKIKKNDVIKFIEQYYCEQENRNVKVTIKAETEKSGYGVSEADTVMTQIVLNEEVTICGTKFKTKENLSQDQVGEILKWLLAVEGYDVVSINYDDGIRSHIEGMYMDEHEVKQAYFNGIDVEAVRKTKQKTIGVKQ